MDDKFDVRRIVLSWNLRKRRRGYEQGTVGVRAGRLLRIVPFGWGKLQPPYGWLARKGKTGKLRMDLELGRSSALLIDFCQVRAELEAEELAPGTELLLKK